MHVHMGDKENKKILSCVKIKHVGVSFQRSLPNLFIHVEPRGH